MAQIFRRLGSKVAIIETGPRLTGREDADVSAAITEMLQSEGHRRPLHRRVYCGCHTGETEGGTCVQLQTVASLAVATCW